MRNQNDDHQNEIEIENLQQEYDLDIYNHKDTSTKKKISTTSFQKAFLSQYVDRIEDAKLTLQADDSQLRKTNYTENMSIKSAGLTISFQNDSSEEKNVKSETKELKCSVCNKKADGVCAFCLVKRFCKSCFDTKHKNDPFQEDPNNIHKFTLYKKPRKQHSSFKRRKREDSIISTGSQRQQKDSLSGSSSATLRPEKIHKFSEEKMSEKSRVKG